jgi:uncharacterized protein
MSPLEELDSVGCALTGQLLTASECTLEQRPRAQSQGTVTMLPRSHGLVFTTRERRCARNGGWSASPVRHG